MNGIQVSITYKATNFNEAIDSSGSFIAQLVKGGVVVGTTLGGGITVDGNSHTVTIGSSSNLWGTSFAPSDITSSGFGVIFYGAGYSDIGTFPEGLWTFGYTVQVDYVTITVTGG